MSTTVTKPIYTYRKGVGWHVAPSGPVVTSRDGYKVRLEHRPPEAGEYYILQWTDYKDWWSNGAPVMQRFALHVSENYFTYQARRGDNTLETAVELADGSSADPVYVTIVPVESP